MELGVDPFAVLEVVDTGDVDVIPANLAASHASLRERLTEVLSAGAMPLVLGGDHSISHSMLQALAERYGVDGYAVIHFDTHTDTGAEVMGVTDLSHGTPFRLGVEKGVMRGDHVYQIGLRGAWPFPEDFQWMREQGFRWATMGDLLERGLGTVVREAIAHAAAQAPRTYLSVDIDVLDPAFAPGTGTAEPGGLMTRELLGLSAPLLPNSISARWTWLRSPRPTTTPASPPSPPIVSCWNACPASPSANPAISPVRSAVVRPHVYR